ncbi:MAG: hypothetical protein O3B64_01765 [bacterium]|nr:hypothetical protein [bacterium]MDA1024361.1 hypothetical protein [bacterium]
MNDQFARILRLAQKTGETVIVTNETAEHPVVIVPFETYASLRSGGQPVADAASSPALQPPPEQKHEPRQEALTASSEAPGSVMQEAPVGLPVAKTETRIPIEKTQTTTGDRAYEPIPGREEEPDGAFEAEERFYLESLE